MDEKRGSEQSEREAARLMMAGLLAQRRLGFFNRLAARAEWQLSRWSAYWATLSRKGRRAFWRKMSPALLGAALLGALVAAPQPAAAAGIVVDGATCTLVDAVLAAETDTAVGGCAAGSGADVIDLQAVVTLTAPYGLYYGNDTGLPLVTTTITIEGNGHFVERDTGDADTFRLLAVSATGDLTLNDLTLRGGYAEYVYDPYSYHSRGGGIYNSGALTLNKATISDNRAYYDGGGVFNRGTLTISDSALSGNSAVGSYGGGIFNFETLIIENSTVSDNYAAYGGGGVHNRGGDVTISHSTLSGNTGRRRGGGGIYNSGALTLNNATVSDNRAYKDGGGVFNRGTLTISDGTLSGNSAVGSYGGGIFNSETLIIENSTVSDNYGAYGGGGVFNLGGDVTISHSTLSGNTGRRRGGGGVYNGDSNAFGDGVMTISYSTVEGNSADPNSGGGGGGLSNHGDLRIDHSAIVGNTTSNLGGGVDNRGALAISNSTISGNEAHAGGGVFTFFHGGSDTVTISDTTISDNTANIGGGLSSRTYSFFYANISLARALISGNKATGSDAEVNGSGVTFIAESDNLFGHGAIDNETAFGYFTPGASDITATSDGTDPTPLAAILDPLADNGGPTITHALPPGSPAIDAAATGPADDQRGEPRPGGAAFDIGSYELQPSGPVMVFSGFFSPVDNAPIFNKAKGGSTIPVKFSLGDDFGLSVFEVGYPIFQRIACDSSAPLNAIEQTMTAGQSGLQYDPATGQYTYVWKTQKSWGGTCRQLILRFSDGTERVALFNFK